MQSVDEWLDEYGESHRNPANKLIHWVCVPLIVFSLIGLLWSIPVPGWMRELSPFANWAVLFILAALVYYFIMSLPLALGMLIVSVGLVLTADWLARLAAPLWAVSIAVFVVAWVGQFIGHIIEGKRPSFFKDLQFLLIGPIWLLSALYRKLGIPY